MKNRFLKISLSGLAAVAAFSFIACGDDVSEVTRIQQPAVFNAVADSLPACDTATSGKLYVSSEKLLLCDGEKWSGLNGVSAKDGVTGSFCSTTTVKDGLKILCDGDSVGVIKNGVAGAAGGKGPAGESGSYCVAEENAFGYDIYCDGELTGTITNGAPGSSGSKGVEGDDGTYCVTSATSTGFDVVCNGEKIGEISNGTPGSSGSKGREGDDGMYCVTVATATGFDLVCNGEKVGEIDNGTPGSAGSKGDVATGCTFTKNENGSYTQKCGDKESVVYAAVCGTESYNPLGNKFCYGITLYDKCDGKDYNPAKQFCLDGALTELCGGKNYTAGEFCLNNEVTAKCDGKTFEENEFCQGSTIKEKCGEKTYTVDQFCDGTTVVDKCDGSVYSPATESCTTDGVRPKCGTTTYNPETQFCQEGTPTALCGGKTYTTSQFCLDNAVTAKCNGSTYTTSQFCLNNAVTNKCNGKTYTTDQFCLNNVVTAKCGGKTYTTSQFCSGTTVYDKCGSSTYTPSSQFCDTRDNHIYKYVKIGTQTWMAQNLNYASSNSWCYNGTASNCDSYGRLYTWSSALNIDSKYNSTSYSVGSKHQGKCPSGWHIPSTGEWNTLSSTVEDGASLRAKDGWGTNGTDKYGFNAKPAGIRDNSGTFYYLGTQTYFWSTGERTVEYAYYRYFLGTSTNLASAAAYAKSRAFSVRCLKN